MRYELRVTWLGGMLILDRLEEAGYDVFTRRPTIGRGDVPGAGVAGDAMGRAFQRNGARRGPMSRNTNFYYSFLVLTPAKRRAIIAVWDFCRAIDDTVDERAVDSEPQRVEAFEALAAWRKEIEAVFTPGVAPATPQGRALQPLARHFRLPRRPFEDLIDGVSMDVGFRRYRTFNELYQYLLQGRVDRRPRSASRSSAAAKRRRATTPSISASRCSSPTSCVTSKAISIAAASTCRSTISRASTAPRT